MRFVSLEELQRGFTKTVRRFPLPIFFSVYATAIAIFLTEVKNLGDWRPYEWLENLLMVVYLGLPLFIASDSFFEVNSKYKTKRTLSQCVCALLMTLYYVSLPQPSKTADLFRFGLIALALHFLVAIAPFILTRGKINGFWQYNRHLFLRFAESFIYSVTIYVGVVLALWLFSELFDVKIPSEVYFKFWLFVVGVFNTIFFLAGVPEDIAALDKLKEYPQKLKVFTQYVLIPLVTVYLLILVAYAGKITVSWNLPKGMVGYMVTSAAVFGMLTLLLIHPVKDLAANRWMRVYGQYFYLALFPLIVLLGVSIYRRTADYGITENRYLLIVLAPWLLAMALYFTFSKKKNIKIIPTSIFVLLVLMAFGPWSATAVSKWSQTSRLLHILQNNGLLVDGKLVKAAKPLSFDDKKDISSILDYLDHSHGLAVLKKHIADPALMKDPLFTGDILKSIGIDYVGRWEKGDTLQVYRPRNDGFSVHGFDYVFHVNAYEHSEYVTQVAKEETPFGPIEIIQKPGGSILVFQYNHTEIAINLLDALKQPRDKDVYLKAENSALRVQILIENLYAQKSGDTVTLQSMNGQALVKFKK